MASPSATSTTTAVPTSSSPAGDRMPFTATGATARSKTSPIGPAWAAIATGRPRRRSPISTTTATSTSTSATTSSGTPSTRLCASATAKPGEPIDPDQLYEYCMPNPFPARPDHLFRNDGGRFVDVTAEAGIVDPNGRGLGVVAADLDDDGLIDLFVANDTTANYLWHNLGGMKFEEVGVSQRRRLQRPGRLPGRHGHGRAATSTATACPTSPSPTSTASRRRFSGTWATGIFADQTSAIGLAAPSRYLLGFGIVLFDANNDGRLDLAQTNGHVVDDRPDFPLEMPGLLMIGGGRRTACRRHRSKPGRPGPSRGSAAPWRPAISTTTAASTW